MSTPRWERLRDSPTYLSLFLTFAREKKNMAITDDNVKKFSKAIMNRFREVNAGKGHVLPQAWLTWHLPFYQEQQVAFEQAMQQLQAEHFIEYEKKGKNQHRIMLTQLGENYLYPNFSKADTKQKIQKNILAKFKANQDKTIPLRWLNSTCFGQFNPKEQRLFNDVIESMLAEQLMITSFTKLQFYLTEKGEKLMGECLA
jgi:predicted transcriptional regulator